MRTMPAPGFAPASTGRWVSDAGCCTSESTPPSETACVISRQASVKRAAAAYPPARSSAMSEPAPAVWRADQALRVLAGRPG